MRFRLITGIDSAGMDAWSLFIFASAAWELRVTSAAESAQFDVAENGGSEHHARATRNAFSVASGVK